MASLRGFDVRTQLFYTSITLSEVHRKFTAIVPPADPRGGWSSKSASSAEVDSLSESSCSGFVMNPFACNAAPTSLLSNGTRSKLWKIIAKASSQPGNRDKSYLLCHSTNFWWALKRLLPPNFAATPPLLDQDQATHAPIPNCLAPIFIPAAFSNVIELKVHPGVASR